MYQITPKQKGFIETLLDEKEVPESNANSLRQRLALGQVTGPQASDAIGYLKTCPSKVQVTKPGVFELEDGTIYVVKPNRAGTRMYAKRLVEIGGERLTEEGNSVVNFDFEYDPGAVFRIKESDRMDLDRAKELAIRYGSCLNCGRRLKAAESVERGIGPVCAKRFAQVAA